MVTGSGWSKDPVTGLALKRAGNNLILPAPFNAGQGNTTACCGCYCYTILLLIFRKSDCHNQNVACANLNETYLHFNNITFQNQRKNLVAGQILTALSIFSSQFGAGTPVINFTVDQYGWQDIVEDATYFTIGTGLRYSRGDSHCFPNNPPSDFSTELAAIPSGLKRGCTVTTNWQTRFTYDP